MAAQPGSRRPRLYHLTGDLGSRTYLVTGANTGIGRVTAQELAARGARVFLACRSPAKGQEALAAIREATGADGLELLTLDLGDLDSVRAAAQTFLGTGEPLHGLINNAGLAGQRGLTASGFEVAFGTNHVGPFLLTNLLLDRIRESAPARIVIVASDAHYRAEGIDFEAVRRPTATRTAFAEYGVSKLANVLHAQELARRLQGTAVTTYSLHPGVVASDVWRRVPWPIRPIMKLRMRSTQEGAQTSLYCATDPAVADQSGLYYEDCRHKAAAAIATPELGAELWRHSESWTS
ncbi:MAG: SDR family oxidoreductase [Solirubrobacteraceae bacterium]